MYHMEFPSPGTLCTARSINSHPMYACAHVEPKNSSRLSCGVQIGPWRPRRAAEARPSGEEQNTGRETSIKTQAYTHKTSSSYSCKHAILCRQSSRVKLRILDDARKPVSYGSGQVQTWRTLVVCRRPLLRFERCRSQRGVTRQGHNR
ncbi:hypothetical protein GN956_G13738 [Arapaima gigas]